MKSFIKAAALFLHSPEAKWTLLAALAVWLAFPNQLVQLPIAILLYPIALARLVPAQMAPAQMAPAQMAPAQMAPDRTALARTAPSGPFTKRRVFRLGWFAGFLGHAAAIYWIAIVPHDFGHMPWVVAAPFPLLLSAYIGLYSGLFTLAARQFAPLPLAPRAVALGCLWVCLEYLRGWLFTGFPWMSLSSAFVAWPLFAQGASLLGMYGLSGLLVCIALLIGLYSPRPLLHKGAGCLFLAALLVYGWFSLDNLAKLEADIPARTAILVQGDIDQNIKWNEDTVQGTINKHIVLSERALEQNPEPDLIVWSETAAPFILRAERKFLLPILYFIRHSNISLLTGAPGLSGDGPMLDMDLENRAELISPEGMLGWYAKEHLVPFGEYVPPFLDFEFLAFALQEVGGFSPGTEQAPLPLKDKSGATIPLGVLICYEAIFPELAANRAADGAQVLVNISNDAWFGHSPAMRQHLQQAAMRCIEQRRWMLRATSNGLTAIIDAGGRVVAQAPSHTATTLTGEFKPLNILSPFLHIRAFILPVCCAALLLAIWASRRYIRLIDTTS